MFLKLPGVGLINLDMVSGIYHYEYKGMLRSEVTLGVLEGAKAIIKFAPKYEIRDKYVTQSVEEIENLLIEQGFKPSAKPSMDLEPANAPKAQSNLTGSFPR